jgi:AcrR family transcriptional regulator
VLPTPPLAPCTSSRDDLLAALVTAGYAQLTDALRDAARAASDQPPARRLHGLARAYRGWATTHPRHYELLFGIRPRGDGTDSAEAVDTAHGGMRLLRDVFLDLVRDSEPAPPGDALDRELQSWSEQRADPEGIPPLVLRLGVLAWTRLHGIVGLELTGALAQMNLDPALLVEHEVRHLVTEATSPP